MTSKARKENKRITASDFVSGVKGPYRRLLSFLKPYRGRFLLGLLCGAIYGALNGVLIFGVGYVSSEVLPKDDAAGRGHTSVAEVWHEKREVPELRAAMASVPEAEREAAVASYAAFRAHLHDQSLRSEGEKASEEYPPLHPALPAEFRLCLEGERSFLSGPAGSANPNLLEERLPDGKTDEHVKTARARWEEVLALPEDQRLHRTVWARYLLARTDPDKRTKEVQLKALQADLESGKFTDVLNLADVAPVVQPFGRIILLCMIIPAMMLLRAVFGYWNAYCLTWVSLRVLNDIRSRLFERVLGQSMEFFNRQKSGDLMQTVMSQTRVAQDTLSTVSSYIIKEPLSIISALGVLFWIDAKFTLMALVLFPLLIVPVSLVGKRVRRHASAEQQEAGKMSVIMQEALIGVREVKSYNREAYETGRFKKANWSMLTNMMRWRKVLEATGPAVEVMASVGVAGALVYVWSLQMPASQFIALNGGLVLLYPPAKALSKIPILLQRCLAATNHVFELMDREPDVRDAPDAKPLTGKVEGRITLEDVSFAYKKGVPAVRGVSLDIAPRESVAIVGRSGAGKSTVFNLLLRLYETQSGRILLDGHDIQGLTQVSLREQIGVVSQEVFLFHDTIFENIRYGRLNATEEEIHEAAKRAHAHDFILEQPLGYQTVIGDKGSLLSGGQRQRISIARAFLKNAPVLLLDEAMSALDTEAERYIQDAIAHLAEGKTVIAIAHRLATVIKSDRIVVMRDGVITAVGSHAELLETSDLYRKLYSLQFHA